MNARVRRPGASVAETPSAAPRRAVRSGDWSRRQREVEHQLLAVELHPEARHLLAEQPAPGALARDRLLGQDLLLGLGQQVRPVAAGAAQVVATETQRLVGEQLVDAIVGELGPFELEEQELGLDRRRALLHERQQRPALRVGGVGRESQRRVRARAPDELADLPELVHRHGEAGRIELGDLSGVGGRERGRALVGLVELAPHPFVPLAVDQRAEIPLGLEQFGVRQQFGCGCHRRSRLVAAHGLSG